MALKKFILWVFTDRILQLFMVGQNCEKFKDLANIGLGGERAIIYL